MSCVNFLAELPVDCLALILSRTSPGDVLRASAASKQLLSVSESDKIWENFMPPGCEEIFSQSSTPLEQFASQKALCLHLYRSHILFNNNTQTFELEKRNGKKSYMLSASALEIEWGKTPQYWKWKSIPESRFPEVAELQVVWWLDIQGEIHTRLLSSNTTYGAYFVFKTEADNFRGFDKIVKVCLSVAGQAEGPSQSYYLSAPQGRRQSLRRPPRDLPVARADGWMEIELGRYHVGDDHGGVVLKMTLKEVEELHEKGGIIVEGVQLRPLD